MRATRDMDAIAKLAVGLVKDFRKLWFGGARLKDIRSNTHYGQPWTWNFHLTRFAAVCQMADSPGPAAWRRIVGLQ